MLRIMDLKKAAKQAKVSGIVIAARLGVANATVSRWLNGKTPVPSRHARDVAKLLKIRPQDVLPPSK